MDCKKNSAIYGVKIQVIRLNDGDHPHEAGYLKLDISKARAMLGWVPRRNLEQALISIVEWTKAYSQHQDMRSLCLQQLEKFQTS